MRRDPGLHVYEIGDLDPFFRPRTRWFGWTGEALEAFCLLYTGSTPPTLLALCRPDQTSAMLSLLEALQPRLPSRVYGHLSPALAGCFVSNWTAQDRGRHLKMLLTDPAALHTVNIASVIAPTAADIEALTAFYDASYPGHWFDARMLESGQYRGIREGGRWLAAAGVHVYSGGVSRRRARQHRHCPCAQTAGAWPRGHGRGLPIVAGERGRDRSQRARRQWRRTQMLRRSRLHLRLRVQTKCCWSGAEPLRWQSRRLQRLVRPPQSRRRKSMRMSCSVASK